MSVLRSLTIIIIRISEREIRENVLEEQFREQIIENFQDLIKDTSLSSQKA